METVQNCKSCNRIVNTDGKLDAQGIYDVCCICGERTETVSIDRVVFVSYKQSLLQKIIDNN